MNDKEITDLLWLDDQLMRGRAIVSDDWYMDHGSGTHRYAKLATQILVPENIARFTIYLEEYLGRLADNIFRIEGKVVRRTGESQDIGDVLELSAEDPAYMKVLWELLHRRTRIRRRLGSKQGEKEIEESRHPFRAEIYLNWATQGDLKKTVPYGDLRQRLLPGKCESMKPCDLEMYRSPPYCFDVPKMTDYFNEEDYELDYEIREVMGMMVASLPQIACREQRKLDRQGGYLLSQISERKRATGRMPKQRSKEERYRKIFLDAANAHLEYDTRYAGAEIGMWLAGRLKRAAEKSFQEEYKKADSEIDLPALY